MNSSPDPVSTWTCCGYFVRYVCVIHWVWWNTGEETKHVDDNKEKLVTATKKGAAVLDQWLSDEIKLQYHVLQRVSGSATVHVIWFTSMI